jgi:hypothetical protein
MEYIIFTSGLDNVYPKSALTLDIERACSSRPNGTFELRKCVQLAKTPTLYP